MIVVIGISRISIFILFNFLFFLLKEGLVYFYAGHEEMESLSTLCSHITLILLFFPKAIPSPLENHPDRDCSKSFPFILWYSILLFHPTL